MKQTLEEAAKENILFTIERLIVLCQVATWRNLG